MRKFYYVCALALAVAAAGCGKVAEPEVLQRISVNVGSVQSGELGTKGVSDALALAGPTGTVQLNLIGLDVAGRQFSLAAGSEAVVPVGRYRVQGTYVGEEKGKANGNSIYWEPSYSVNEEIEVEAGVEQYAVSAQYECWALVLDEAEVEKYRHKVTWSSDWTDVTMKSAGTGYKVAYFGLSSVEWNSAQAYWLKAVAADVNQQEDVDYRLVHVDWSGGVKVQKGKWYKFGARDVETQSGDIVIGMPEWQAGN